MTCFRMIPNIPVRNFHGNSPSPRPVGCFGTLFPVFPITFLYLIYVEERQKRIRERIRGNAYTRVKVENATGNSSGKQRWRP